MYKTFFNLKEDPFSLNPDPHFLFPSERHREAFRYLLYGIKNREGFIEIIGDVGTGKTLLCRALLALLGNKVKSALILNPPFSDVEFFEAVVRDLGIHKKMESRRGVLDSINDFVMKEYREGRNVIIIVDEAQHLSVEMLEQIRLLSNLETEKKKLLQIILVGQPELEDKLRNPRMKQLDQRIALRYYLEPLRKKEVKEYIYHRLRVAGASSDLQFTRGALKKIFRFSKGTQRLINVVCDKALLTAYFFKTKEVSAKCVTIALRSTQRRWRRFPRFAPISFSHALSSFAVLTVLLLLALNWRSYENLIDWTKKMNHTLSVIKTNVLHRLHMPPVDGRPIERKALDGNPKEQETGVVQANKAPPPTVLVKNNETYQPAQDKQFNAFADSLELPEADYEVLSMANLLAIWRQDRLSNLNSWAKKADGSLNYSGVAQRYGLSVVSLNANLNDLSLINLPCILSGVTDLKLGHKIPLVLTGLSDDWALVIHPNEGELRYSRDELASIWDGAAIFLWHNIDSLSTEDISPWQAGSGIEKVEQRLRQLGYFKGRASDDSSVRHKQRARALMNFQSDHDLEVDGILGMRSRLVMYSIIDQPFTPTLRRGAF